MRSLVSAALLLMIVAGISYFAGSASQVSAARELGVRAQVLFDARKTTEALELFSQAAARGDGEAQFALAKIYSAADIVQENSKEYWRWLRMAASSGIVPAMTEAATNLLKEPVDDGEASEAMMWIERANRLGSSEARALLKDIETAGGPSAFARLNGRKKRASTCDADRLLLILEVGSALSKAKIPTGQPEFTFELLGNGTVTNLNGLPTAAHLDALEELAEWRADRSSHTKPICPERQFELGDKASLADKEPQFCFVVNEVNGQRQFKVICLRCGPAASKNAPDKLAVVHADI